MNSGSNSPAFHNPSERTNRPSASVLRTSMVLPESVVMTSPGRCAFAAGMFSAMHVIPTTLPSYPVDASACIVPKTVADPPISYFISSMLAPGLSEIPPVSNVIPFPTRRGQRPGFSLFIAKMTMHGFRDEPMPTATRPPMPAFMACS